MLTQEIRVREFVPNCFRRSWIKNTDSMLDIEPDDDQEVLDELTGNT